MFANRFTILVDACSLFGALSRNLLLSLAEAEFFRVRWSNKILEETERAILKSFASKNDSDAESKAKQIVAAIDRAFPEAIVTGHETLIDCLRGVPDQGDAHVIAAAVKTRASVIVTENIKHFPEDILYPLDLTAKSADDFISDTIDLDKGRAISVIREMRERFKKPEITSSALLLRMEAVGLIQTADSLREHELSI